MKRIFAALAAVMLFGACSGMTVPRETTVTTVSGSAGTAIPKQFLFAVDQNSDETLITAAENFCRRVNSISDGVITLTLVKAENPLDDFRSGKAGFVLLEGEKPTVFHPIFAATSERFRYRGYENFSMACNSAQILRLLSEVCGAKVYAAYYTGSNLLASFSPADSILAFNRDGTLVREVGAFTIPGSGAALSLDLLGVDAVEIPSVSERLRRLSPGGSIAELAFFELVPEELATLSPDLIESDTIVKDEAEPDVDAGDGEGVQSISEYIVVTRTFHSVTPAWLILEPSLYESLNKQSRAAVDEAAAYMYGDIDAVYLKNEQDKITLLEAEGIVVSGKFTSSRARILGRQGNLHAETSAVEKRFRELLDELS